MSSIFSWRSTQQILVQGVKDLLDSIARGDGTSFVKAGLNDPNILIESYRTTNAYVLAAELACALAVFHIVMGEITKNYSQVDKAWSILPPIYSWHFTLHDYLNRGSFNPRLLLATLLITTWGIRLTYNFARKGGYEWSGRDYRFTYIHEKIGNIGMFLLNIIFIGPMQDTLFILMTAPLYASSLVKTTHLTLLDGVTATLFLALLLLEVIADDQQLMFQTKKHALLDFVRNDREQLTGDYKRGFLCSSGLWKYSRHPNFFAEQSLWWVVYLFSIITRVEAGDATWTDPSLYLHWTGLGAFFLTLLFQGSTWLTEYISAEKYPDYRLYQKSVNRFIPWFSKPMEVPSKKRN